jgi:ADP-heptose:LPS heptosyltransferase
VVRHRGGRLSVNRLLVRAEKLARALLAPRRRSASWNKVLIANNLLLGDTFLLAPLLKVLQQIAPDADRVVMTRPAFLPLFANRPYGVRAIPFTRRDGHSQRQVMNSGPYDIAIVPDDNRYAWLARAAGARWVTGFAGDRPGWKNWMLDESIAYASSARAWADMLPTLVGRSSIDPFVAGEWSAPPAAALPESLPNDFVVLHVGASSVLKQWPAQRWIEIASLMRSRQLQVRWSGAAAERQILDEIAPPAEEAVLFGNLDLGQLWHLLSQARALVSADTGIAHMARVAGVPAAVIFGPGSAVIHGAGEFWRDAPSRVVTKSDFPCRNQHRFYRREIAWVERCGRGLGIGPGKCPSALCMQAVGVHEVYTALSQLLSAGRASG